MDAKTLNRYKDASQIVHTGQDSAGNTYNSFGTLNQAAWLGEHAHFLIAEIERLQKLAAMVPETPDVVKEREFSEWFATQYTGRVNPCTEVRARVAFLAGFDRGRLVEHQDTLGSVLT